MSKDFRYMSQEIVEIIGAEIKRRRLASYITLEESDCGCSVSYLSKIENGKIIPKFTVLQEICQKRGMTDKELESLVTLDDKISTLIENIFWQNHTEICKLYDSVSMFDNYKCNLIKMVYEMNFYHWGKVENYSNSISIIKSNLKNNDLYLYIYLLMCINNHENNYPEVYLLYKSMKECKNEFLLALASKEMFKAVCNLGIENPIYCYEEFNKRYVSLLNYDTHDMYNLLLETLIKLEFELSESIIKQLKKELKLMYYLTRNDEEKIDEMMYEYKLSNFEKLLIYTRKKDYYNAEKIFKKIEIYKLSAEEIIIVNYCNIINKGNDEELAEFIINTGLDYAKKTNNGQMFLKFLHKLSEISFSVGKYKTVVTMNLVYFNMINRCKLCML